MSKRSCVRFDVSIENGVRWVDLDIGHDDFAGHAHRLIPNWPEFEANFSSEIPPVGYVEHSGGLFLSFRGADYNSGKPTEDMVVVRAWCSETLLVTASRRETRSAADLNAKLTSSPGLEQDGGLLLLSFAKRLAVHLIPLSSALEFDLDELEDKLVTGTVDDHKLHDRDLSELRREGLQLRRRILGARRGLLPQLELLDDLEENLPAMLSREVHGVPIQEARLRFARVMEQIEAKRERVALLAEEVVALQSESTNHRTYVFTVVAGVFLPLGLLTGLLGVNVGGVPGVDDPAAFWWLCLLLLALGIGLWIPLRVRR